MNGLKEIRDMNRNIPQTKREVDFRVQRDRLGQVLRKVLAQNLRNRLMSGVERPDETEARKVLAEIFGEKHG